MGNTRYYNDVFIPGGTPTVTYNPRRGRNLEDRVQQTKKNICKLMIITGPTKTGKTVLVEKVFGREKPVWIEGGSICDNEEYFWENVIAQLQIASEFEEHQSQDMDFEITAEGQLKIPFIQTGVGVSGSVSRSHMRGQTLRSSVSNKTAAIRFLSENRIPLIVDDFHYIDRNVQTAIVRALKAPVMHGLPVVFIAIPNRKFDVLKVEREMTGRLEIFEIPSWSLDELAMIADTGFQELNVHIPDTLKMSLAQEALSSPHLMQEFCKAICEEQQIVKPAKERSSVDESIDLPNLFQKIARNTGRPLFEKLARGPRQRSDRIKRRLKDGTVTDIYGAVMAAFVQMKPGMDSVNYDRFRGYLRDVLDSDLPQKNEITRVLDKLTEICYNTGASTPVIDWDSEEDILTITDSFFAFYLRWKGLTY
ncbi:ATP-binding protein [Candidatus Soleaferrea massiliensis]|uniref:ATP-binding protein n=1 Tax=Candidatus Soleaferrea massiliensis TaxID=1470354 RepID=UPI00058C70BE|nr:ATP-binding protein [Candidatus Soleaferrea massiliensis]